MRYSILTRAIVCLFCFPVIWNAPARAATKRSDDSSVNAKLIPKENYKNPGIVWDKNPVSIDYKKGSKGQASAVARLRGQAAFKKASYICDGKKIDIGEDRDLEFTVSMDSWQKTITCAIVNERGITRFESFQIESADMRNIAKNENTPKSYISRDFSLGLQLGTYSLNTMDASGTISETRSYEVNSFDARLNVTAVPYRLLSSDPSRTNFFYDLSATLYFKRAALKFSSSGEDPQDYFATPTYIGVEFERPYMIGDLSRLRIGPTLGIESFSFSSTEPTVLRDSSHMAVKTGIQIKYAIPYINILFGTYYRVMPVYSYSEAPAISGLEPTVKMPTEYGIFFRKQINSSFQFAINYDTHQKAITYANGDHVNETLKEISIGLIWFPIVNAPKKTDAINRNAID